jgi:hypothetical protein
MAMEEDFCLLGLVSDEPDYRLCWLLNRHTGCDFTRQDDLELYHKKQDRNQHFPLFLHEDPDTFVHYRIIRNRVEEGFFLEELKNLDFLLHIQGDLVTERIDEFILTANAIPGIRMCVPVELAKIRKAERLYLW